MWIINQKETMKQIGWKLKDECKIYEQVAKDICKVTLFDTGNHHFCVNSVSESKLKKSGVLELWFEPVYEKEKQFKVGDWVKIINLEGRVDGNVGEIFEIKKIIPHFGVYSFYNKDIKGNYFQANNLILATEEEIKKATTPKFKVGDWVKKAWKNNAYIDIFKISKIIGNNIYSEIYYRNSTLLPCTYDCVANFSDNRVTLSLASKKEIEEVETIYIASYKVNFSKHNECTINGTCYTKSELIALKNIMEKGQIKSLNVGCQGQFTVDLEMIKKILNKI